MKIFFSLVWFSFSISVTAAGENYQAGNMHGILWKKIYIFPHEILDLNRKFEF